MTYVKTTRRCIIINKCAGVLSNNPRMPTDAKYSDIIRVMFRAKGVSLFT